MTRDRDAAFVILFLSMAALATALIAQFGFGLLPCHLCLYQRVPYGVTMLLALLILGLQLSPKQMALLLALSCLAFLANSGLAFYHVGVEQHWWAGPTSCTSGLGGVHSVEDLRAVLSRPINIPSCDEIQWSLFGISMAGYNVAASLGLAIFAGRATMHSFRRQG